MEIHMAEAPPELLRELREQLEEGETLLWVGWPKRGIMFRYEDIFAIPFFLIWTFGPSFGVVWVLLAGGGIRYVGVFLGVVALSAVFLVVGSYLLVGRYIVDRRRRERTIYALTNERALILFGAPGRWQRSVSMSKLGTVIPIPYWDARMTIKLGRMPFFAVYTLRGLFGEKYRWPEFERIEDGKAVMELIERARDKRI